ncbi:MAG: DUF2817 domain-containing protein [Nocardioidaceae bacterium]|nr:DUF2817 domain-containing protein [Nocardioidaceae bacterium]
MRRLLSGSLLLPLLLALLTVPSRAEARAVTQVRTIGWTVEGRPIRAFRLGDPTSPNKAVFLGTIHGDEAGPAKILANLRDGAPITGADVWVVLYMNRDGFAHHRRTNARKVDLNRNFPVGWRRLTGRYYSGHKPASEPETRFVMRFLDGVNPDYVIGFHQPLYGVDTYAGKTRTFSARLAHHLGLPRKTFTCNSVCHGTMTQWFNAKHAGVAVTVEYGRTVSARQVVVGARGLLLAIGARR